MFRHSLFPTHRGFNSKFIMHFVKKVMILCAIIAGIAFIPAIPDSDSNIAYAQRCTGCPPPDVSAAVRIIIRNHQRARRDINTHTSDEFQQHRNWLTNEFAKGHVIPALQKMTTQLSAVGMHQMFAIGSFFDAKNQLETQRLFNEMEYEAQRDGQISETFCAFGTNVRSLAHSESKARHTANTLMQMSLARQLGKQNTPGAASMEGDMSARWNNFTQTHCDPRGNNWRGEGTGMEEVCHSSPADPDRIDMDINYTRLIEQANTLDIDVSADGQAHGSHLNDVIAFKNNIFAHRVPNRNITASSLSDEKNQEAYLNLRSVIAKRSVAMHSFNTIIGMKSSGTSAEAGNAQYLHAVYEGLGMDPEQIQETIGENPSYYAQLKTLAQSMSRDPNFFANLYTTPANVQRTAVILQAVESMLNTAIRKSQERTEMLTSIHLATKIEQQFQRADKDLGRAQ